MVLDDPNKILSNLYYRLKEGYAIMLSVEELPDKDKASLLEILDKVFYQEFGSYYCPCQYNINLAMLEEIKVRRTTILVRCRGDIYGMWGKVLYDLGTIYTKDPINISKRGIKMIIGHNTSLSKGNYKTANITEEY